ncbi:hypothetical protein ACKFKG_13140 [Phormidesmis sp. 146-35]
MAHKTNRRLSALALSISLLAASGQGAFAQTTSQGGGNPLASLLKQVQDLISQIQAKPQELMEQIQSQVGQTWEGLEGEITKVAGDLGIIDPNKARKTIQEQAKTAKGTPDIPAIVQGQGLEATIVGQSVAQTTLSQEGQRQSKKNLEGIIQTAADSQQLANGSAAITSTDMQAAQSSQQSAQQSGQMGQDSTESAQNVGQIGQQAQSRTSSQDILKLLAQQNAGSGNILAKISGQLSGSAGQLGNLSSQLANNSSQNANSAKLQAAQVQLLANQATSMEGLKQQGAATNLTLSGINEQMRGEQQSRIVQQQAEANQLARINRSGYRLLK